MRVWPALPSPGELVRLPLPCPPQLIELSGYTGGGRLVALWWSPFGDELMICDGTLTDPWCGCSRLLGARPGDQLVDLYPGSGADRGGLATLRRHARRRRAVLPDAAARAPAGTEVRALRRGTDRPLDERLHGRAPRRRRATRRCCGRDRAPCAPYELAVVCCERAVTCPVNGARCESVACIDVGCTAEDANVDAERAA